MGRSINPMLSFEVRGEAVSGSAPSPIVLMSLRPAIPWRVGLHQSPPPLHQPVSMLNPPAETVNHHPPGGGEFSTGRMGNFQPELTLPPIGRSRARFAWHLAAGDLVKDRTFLGVHRQGVAGPFEGARPFAEIAKSVGPRRLPPCLRNRPNCQQRPLGICKPLPAKCRYTKNEYVIARAMPGINQDRPTISPCSAVAAL